MNPALNTRAQQIFAVVGAQHAAPQLEEFLT